MDPVFIVNKLRMNKSLASGEKELGLYVVGVGWYFGIGPKKILTFSFLRINSFIKYRYQKFSLSLFRYSLKLNVYVLLPLPLPLLLIHTSIHGGLH